MSKIIPVINVMISNQDKISEVTRGISDPPTYFFLYDKKHKWSIFRDAFNNYFLSYYTTDLSIEDLANFDAPDWTKFHDYIIYSSRELKTREADESLREIYILIKEISSGADSAFDEIIGSDESF